MKYALYSTLNSQVIQFQDHDLLNYSEELQEGTALLQLPDDFEEEFDDDGNNSPRWVVGGELTANEPAPPPPPPMTAERALAQRDLLLAQATVRIAPLQDALDLEEITAPEQVQLTALKRYRVALNRIDKQTGYPGNVQWPAEPAP